MSRPRTTPVTCPDCGWTATPEYTTGRAAWRVRRHQGGTNGCGGTTPITAPPTCASPGCTRTPAKDNDDQLCAPCHREHVQDHDSPLDLTAHGTWVNRRGVRIFQPHTTHRGTAA